MAKGGRGPFLYLTVLWHNMDLQEAWDISFPPGYELDLKASTRSNKRNRESPRYLANPGVAGAGAANIAHPPQPTPPPQGGGGTRLEEGLIYLMIWYITPAMARQGGEH